jgi:hypothetical protein
MPDANFQFLDLMSFSSSAGEHGILEDLSWIQKSRSRRNLSRRLRIRTKDMFCFENAVAG